MGTGKPQLETLLSKDVKISDYLKMQEEKNKTEIIEFIRSRFTERYITPLRRDDVKKNMVFAQWRSAV